MKRIAILFGLFFGGLAPTIALCAPARTGPYVRTLPSSSIVYPGQTFTLYVEIDNHNLDGHRTDLVQWYFSQPSEFDYITDSASLPSSNDFFAQPADYDISDTGSGDDVFNWRGYVFGSGHGPSDARGYLAQYQYQVPTSLTSGTFQFLMNEDSTQMSDSNGDLQARTLYSEDISIAPAGDANLDGLVDVGDLLVMALHWDMSGFDPANSWLVGDFNADGSVDATDLGILAVHWPGSAASGSLSAALASADLPLTAVPEPAPSAILLILTSLLPFRRRRSSGPSDC